LHSAAKQLSIKNTLLSIEMYSGSRRLLPSLGHFSSEGFETKWSYKAFVKAGQEHIIEK